jgi:hypothetical protein
MVVNWMAVAAVATAAGAAATAGAAAFTANMASKTRQAVQQTKELIGAANAQADASSRQADAAQRQVEYMAAQVQATERAMIAQHTPVLAPAFFGGLAEERSLGRNENASFTLTNGEIFDLRFSALDTPGHVQSRVRYERRRPDLSFIFCLRNVGVGPGVIEDAKMKVIQRNKDLLTVNGFVDDVPAVNRRVLATFRSRDGRKMSQSEHVALVHTLQGTSGRVELSLRYRSPSSMQRRLTTVTYRFRDIGPDPFDLVGALVVLSVNTFDVASSHITAAEPGIIEES